MTISSMAYARPASAAPTSSSTTGMIVNARPVRRSLPRSWSSPKSSMCSERTPRRRATPSAAVRAIRQDRPSRNERRSSIRTVRRRPGVRWRPFQPSAGPQVGHGDVAGQCRALPFELFERRTAVRRCPVRGDVHVRGRQSEQVPAIRMGSPGTSTALRFAWCQQRTGWSKPGTCTSKWHPSMAPTKASRQTLGCRDTTLSWVGSRLWP